MKKISKIQKLILFLILGIILAIGVYILIMFISNKKEDTALTKVKFGYSLYERDNTLYKDIFEKLKTNLNSDSIDYKEYAEYITELFVIDFYSLNNKASKNDVGGLQYIKPSMKDNFLLNATNTIYKYILNDSNKNRNLPEVSSIKLSSIEESTYTIEDVEYSSYIIKLEWTYKKDLDYETKGTFTLIKDGEQLYIIEKN